MENNEEYLTDRIRNHREEIDMDGLWEGVSPHIPKEKKRRKIGFWFFRGMIIVLSMIGVLWMMNSMITSDEGKLVSVENVEIDQNLPQHIVIDKTTNEEEVKVSNIEDEKLSKKLRKKTSLDVNNKLQSEVAVLDPHETIVNQSKINIKSSKAIIPLSTLTDFGQVKKDFASKKALFPNTKTTQIDNDRSYPHLSVKNQQSGKKGRVFLNSLDQLNQSKQLLKSEERPIFSDLEIDLVEVKNPFSNINRWNVYFFGGGGILDRKLKLKSIELKAERNRRDMTIDALGEWSVEAGIGYRLSSKLKVMTGLNYTQIHEEESFESSYLIDVDVETNNLIKKQDGSSFNETENSIAQGRRIIGERRYNQIRLFQIPIRLTYDILQIDKFNMSIGGLASYSIKQKYEGHTSLSFFQESYDITLDKDNKFRTSGSVSYGLFIEGTTHLSDMIDLSIRLGYKQIKNINSEIYLIDQQYNSLTFSSGISRRF